MKRHAAMNRIYRLVWNQITRTWVAVAETAKGRRKSATRRKLLATAILGTLLQAAHPALATTLAPTALPTGGNIVSGSGSIATTGNALTVTQNTQRLIAEWQSYNIGANASVNYLQPSSSAIALNRVLGVDPSVIMGRLNSNGQVFLVNAAGVTFAPGAQVNVGGLVASTLNISNADFNQGHYVFTDSGGGGAITNQADIIASGGTVALIGPSLSNQGRITAKGVLLAAGNQVSLDLHGDGLFSYRIDQGAVDALAENKGLIRADGGMVILSAKAADAVRQSVVNNDGVIEAQTIDSSSGVIKLLAVGGSTTVSGTLDASAPASSVRPEPVEGQNGGFIETSGDHVHIADSARITTQSASGKTGTWLIDPTDFTIAAGSNAAQTASGIGDQTLSTNLGSSNIAIATSSTGAGNGDLFIDGNVAWSNANSLTLTAQRNIRFNHASGIALDGGSNGTVILHAGGNITASATGTQEVSGDLFIATAVSGIGTSPAPLRTQVNQAALTNTGSGGIALTNTGDLTVAAASTNGDVVIATANRAANISGLAGNGGNIAVGTVGSLAGITTTGSGNVNLTAGDSARGIVGGNGGSITVNAELHSAQAATLTAGNGGEGLPGIGGNGGSITVNAALTSGAAAMLTAGHGGYGYSGHSGDGGSIIVNAALSATGAIILTAGNNTGLFSSAGYTLQRSDGGNGGSIIVNAALTSAQTATLTAGIGGASSPLGGTGGNGGGITLNATLSTAQVATLTAGDGGIGGTAGNGGSIASTATGVIQANGSVALTAGAGAAGFHGGGGGSITLNGALASAGATTLAAGKGGDVGDINGALGGNGGSVILNAALASAGAATLTTGNGGRINFAGRPTHATTSGNGGDIVVNAAQLFAQSASLTAGVPGVFGTVSGSTGRIVGANVDVTAATDLSINGAVAPGSGNVVLRAGMNAGNTLTISGPITVANTATDNLTLQGNVITGLPSGIAANALAITTAGSIGSAATPASTSVNALSLHGGDIYLANNKAVTVNASSASGAFYLDNGANDITLAGQVSAQGTGDAIRIAGRNFVNHAGASALATPNGRWIVWSDTPVNDAFGGLQSGNLAVWSSPFNMGSPTLAETGNRFAFSVAPLTGTAVVKATDQSKTYGNTFSSFTYTAFDGGAGATYGNAFTDAGTGAVVLSGTPLLASTGAVNTATRSGGNGGTAVYDITVDLTGVTAAGFTTLTGSNGLLTINQRAITVSADAQNITYGDAVAPLTYTATNLASFDSTATAFTGALARSVGANSASGNEVIGIHAITQGSLAANVNYNVTGFTGSNYTVAARNLTISGASAASKTYDGTTSAVISGAALVNAVGGDAVSLANASSGSFVNKNVGIGKAVTTAMSLSGADAGNYTLTQNSVLSANISARTLIATATGINKVYDALLTGSVSFGDNRVSGDVLAVSGTALFTDKNIGTGKTLNVSGMALTGTDAGNYLINSSSAITAANITAAPLTIRANDASRLINTANPPFNATTTGFVGGESYADLMGALSLTTPAVFVSPAGRYAITPSGVTGSNYSITFVDGTLAVRQPIDGLSLALAGGLPGGENGGSGSGNPTITFNANNNGQGTGDGNDLFTITGGGMGLPEGMEE